MSEQTHFGFSRIDLKDKQARVDDVFHKVASRYDLMNDLMSAGLHRLWKDIFASKVRPSRGAPYRCLDVAGGTGDIAFRIAEAGTRATEIVVLDINADMLEVGRARAAKRRFEARLEFVQANAEDLPFEDNSFDAYTIAFGIRNVPRIERALSEARRVLKRGGRFLCLEFSHVDLPLFDRLYKAYSFAAIPRLGKLVTGDEESYRYLVESIERFPEAEAFRQMIARAGFDRADFTRLTGGAVAIHSGWKL
ncbi:ubiquinone/menaquinone biosynthesis methyltransferase [Methylocella silvestris BL2]|uniref:Ubiquinone/menaquinone biosynthesis C-methyltransferase UbiE n=1 Tax=Methylocella silvestris (strain DSM 15510 / CIP 108128 / LMG 27833 / NCIMB 13906 / BL2) TaxID=395965 RepID=B8ET36_METSB|nr:bifunctional demethylmenaquinone methyltransferase/2-methoxy-6-polyprenyl-1,4-benzoquinol methylase UbiE [Methylocella silvestris]ACK51174.1 ubiquinone/menaquinone biosynthesis methyltransferase [Methylocella silvestris BL2]